MLAAPAAPVRRGGGGNGLEEDRLLLLVLPLPLLLLLLLLLPLLLLMNAPKSSLRSCIHRRGGERANIIRTTQHTYVLLYVYRYLSQRAHTKHVLSMLTLARKAPTCCGVKLRA